MSKSAASIRRGRNILLGFLTTLLLALIVYGILRPSPEEREFNRLREIIVSGEHGRMDGESRHEFQRAFEKLSPETRDKLVREIIRTQIREARKEIKDLTDEQKTEKIAELADRTRRDFASLSSEQKARIREELNSQEGRERFKTKLELYSTELSAKEREMLDPLVYETIEGLRKL